MQAAAHLKYARIAPRKVKIVCDLIRGKDTGNASAILLNTKNASAELLSKLLKSAVANAENNFELDPDRLFVSKVFVAPGPILKRGMPRARGGMNRINKRTSHITIVVEEKEE